MKKFWLITAVILLFTSCQESLEERCEREAREYTQKNCPMKMDNNTILDSMTFERATLTLHYYYRLTGFADQDSVMDKVDATNILKNELKNTTTLKAYKDSNYRFAYTFRSEKDPTKILFDATFTAEDYQ